jgi:hypothetical protein
MSLAASRLSIATMLDVESHFLKCSSRRYVNNNIDMAPRQICLETGLIRRYLNNLSLAAALLGARMLIV